jgi:hypothetical protein
LRGGRAPARAEKYAPDPELELGRGTLADVGSSVELLYFDGCPNVEATRRALESALEGVDIRMVLVETPDDAERLRFLGSPTVRVDGRDIEPGADERADYAFACRVYRTADGVSDVPDMSWLRAAVKG